MTKEKRELLTFSKDDGEEQKIHFRRLRKKRPSKKLWLLVIMAAVLVYLIIMLRSRY